MSRGAWVLLLGMLPGSAWADCVYTGAKRAYLECIYTTAVDAMAQAADAWSGLVDLQVWGDGVDTTLQQAEGRMTTAEASIGTIVSRIDTILQNLDSLEDARSAQDLVIETLTGDLDSLTSQLLVLDGDLVLLEQADVSFDSRLGVAEGSLSVLSSELTILSGNFEVFDDVVVDFDSRLDDVEGSLGAVEGDVAGLQSEVATLQSGQSDLDGDVGALTSAVTGLQGSVAGHSSTIGQLRALENMRALISKTAATSHCPSGTAIHVPIGYAGQTGNQICAADTRSRPTCLSVQYVYVTNENGSGSYDPGNLACNQAVIAPWPWGLSSASPNSYGPEWGHGDTWVVCCN